MYTPPIDQIDVVNKGYCDNNLSNNKIDILSKK